VFSERVSVAVERQFRSENRVSKREWKVVHAPLLIAAHPKLKIVRKSKQIQATYTCTRTYSTQKYERPTRYTRSPSCVQLTVGSVSSLLAPHVIPPRRCYSRQTGRQASASFYRRRRQRFRVVSREARVLRLFHSVRDESGGGVFSRSADCFHKREDVALIKSSQQRTKTIEAR
jgi:hypothetical protein